MIYIANIVSIAMQSSVCIKKSSKLVARQPKLEDLTVLKRSPDLLNNVKIRQDQLQLIMKHILFNGGCCHFGQMT